METALYFLSLLYLPLLPIFILPVFPPSLALVLLFVGPFFLDFCDKYLSPVRFEIYRSTRFALEKVRANRYWIYGLFYIFLSFTFLSTISDPKESLLYISFIVLSGIATLIVGHEMIHKKNRIERIFGEFLFSVILYTCHSFLSLIPYLFYRVMNSKQRG